MKKKKSLDGISIQNFVSYYLGTEHDCIKLKHQGLKSFNNPYVIGASNDLSLKYPDFVMRQELIVVIDDFGKPGTYVNPHNIEKIIELEIMKEKIKLLEKIICYNFDEGAMLYQIWMRLINDINCLEKLYSGTYELLFLMNKTRLLREIRKHAKEEAKRTLLFTKIKLDNEKENDGFIYNCNNDLVNIKEDDEQVIDYIPYQVTEKINRQKKLNYKAR